MAFSRSSFDRMTRSGACSSAIQLGLGLDALELELLVHSPHKVLVGEDGDDLSISVQGYLPVATTPIPTLDLVPPRLAPDSELGEDGETFFLFLFFLLLD